jgi:hypothetical protein
VKAEEYDINKEEEDMYDEDDTEFLTLGESYYLSVMQFKHVTSRKLSLLISLIKNCYYAIFLNI